MTASGERQALDWKHAMKRITFAVVLLLTFAATSPLRADDGSVEMRDSEDNFVAEPGARPAALTALMASYVALQALDLSSTYRTHQAGGWEANPLIRQALESPAALIAMKAGSAALTIAVANHVAKRHPTAAILLMIGMNSGYAMIVAHNYALRR